MKKQATTVLLVLGAAAFAFGLAELFKLRFESGDVYPAYSSLRSDPLGTMALFESLAKMRGLTVVRDFSADNRLPPGRGSTYLHLAATRNEWLWLPADAVQQIHGYIAEGGRLVITFLPETSRPFSAAAPPSGPGKAPPKNPKPGAKPATSSPLFKDRWGVEFGYESLPGGEAARYEPVPVRNQTELPLPDSLSWHTGMIFTNLNAAWTTIYARGTNPVVMERQFGLGSVVLMSDSFYLSNEALMHDRQPALLAWLIGPSTTIAFDEAHLGLMETVGVATLLRQYRLEGLVAATLLLVGLFIWQQSVSFLPREAGERLANEVTGKETTTGLINLLRRNIAPRDVLPVCFEQWTRSLARRGAHSIARVDQAQAAFAAELARAKVDQDPVKAYREIARALKVTLPTAGSPRPTTNRPHEPNSHTHEPK